MPYTLLLNKDNDSRSMPFESMEAAFDAAQSFINEGYISRVADENGVVQYTQVLRRGVVETHRGDATVTAAAPAIAYEQAPRRSPWWKFW